MERIRGVGVYLLGDAPLVYMYRGSRLVQHKNVRETSMRRLARLCYQLSIEGKADLHSRSDGWGCCLLPVAVP